VAGRSFTTVAAPTLATITARNWKLNAHAKIVGAGARTVQNWASGHNTPRGKTAERLLDIRTIVELLSDSYTEEGIDIWLHSRNRNLDMRRPIDMLTEGQVDRVLEEAKWVGGGM
jgi:hypothetical protein